MLQILELFGGIGSPRIALKHLGIDVKSIDYVEIDESAVRSYNAIFQDEMSYKSQNVIGWNLKPDILIHGSPCQDISIAGHQKGADKGSETRSSLMWETVKIIQSMGLWRPRVVIWENVKNVISKTMRKNFMRYLWMILVITWLVMISLIMSMMLYSHLYLNALAKRESEGQR